MNYNPYAAPQAAPPQAPGALQNGAPQPWEVGEVLTRGWEIYKANWGVLSGAFVVFGLCTGVPIYGVNIGIALSPNKDAYSGLSTGTGIVGQLLIAFFTIGLYRICLTAARGEVPQFATLFSGGSRFLAFFGVSLLTTIATGLGFVLLIVPGVILLCGLWASGYFIADTNLGVIDSIKASWEATRGQRLAFFLFMLVGGLLQVAGMMACCVGVIVSAPVFYVAQAIVFLRITGRGTAALPPPGVGGYGGPPQGYGGPPPGYGGPPPGYGGAPGGGYGGPPPGGGGYGGPPQGGYGPPGGGFPPR